MTRTILAALLLSACTAAPHQDWCDQPPKDLWTQRCDRDAAAAPEKPAPTPDPPHVEPPKEPPHVDPPKAPPHVEPTDDKEPDRATDPEGHKAWKERHGVKP